jgi:hypothetical protein
MGKLMVRMSSCAPLLATLTQGASRVPVQALINALNGLLRVAKGS